MASELKERSFVGAARQSYVSHLRGCPDCSDPSPHRRRCLTGLELRGGWLEESRVHFGTPSVRRTWRLDRSVVGVLLNS